MAELKELAPLIKGGVPTTPKELKPFADKLEAAIKVAQIAMRQKGLDSKKYNEILEQGQEWAKLKLEAELKMKEYRINSQGFWW
ncbi:hypothetical protein FACS1894110_26300 [Spirochaetia bacterium]|nr:hypothetical protein FACS1894110_26300 [Spirochaetia bacterium]